MSADRKRIVRFSAAVSLDGFIAGPGGEIDWILMDPEVDFEEMFSSYDTMVMGRASYEAAVSMGHASWPGMDVFVVSRALKPEDAPSVKVRSDPAAVIAEIREREGKNIWLFGGGLLFRSLLDLGLVDELEVAIIPVMLGRGIPLLADGAKSPGLELLSHRVFQATGTVLLNYALRPVIG